MDYRSLAVGALVALLVVGALGAGLMLGGSGPAPSPEETTATPTATPEPVDQGEVPANVKESKAGAEAMKTTLSDEGYDNARVFIQKNGGIVVQFTSEAENGPALKEDLRDVAFLYSNVKANHTEVGGLTVSANGVTLLVSQDAALAHGEGRINDDAFTKTFVYKQTSNSTEG